MKFWLLSDIDSLKFVAVKKLAAKFNIDYPRVKIDISVKTRQSMWESVFLNLRDPKEHPLADLIEIPHSWTRIMAKLGIITEIGDGIKGARVEDYPGFLKDGCAPNKKGDFFSLPWWLELYTLTYREDALKSVSGAEEKLKTWEGFNEVCEILKNKNRKKNFFVLENSNPSGAFSLYDVLPRIWDRGGRLFNEDFTKSEISKIEVLRGIEDFIVLAQKKYLSLFNENYYELKGLLSEGSRAMVFTGRIPGCFCKEGGPELKAAFYPRANEKGHFVSSSNLAVTDFEKSEDVSLFARYLLTPKNIKFFTESFHVFPCLKSSLEELVKSKNFQLYRDIISKPRMTPDMDIFPTYEFLINNLLKETAVKVIKKTYEREELHKRLMIIQSEVDYLLSSY